MSALEDEDDDRGSGVDMSALEDEDDDRGSGVDMSALEDEGEPPTGVTPGAAPEQGTTRVNEKGETVAQVGGKKKTLKKRTQRQREIATLNKKIYPFRF